MPIESEPLVILVVDAMAALMVGGACALLLIEWRARARRVRPQPRTPTPRSALRALRDDHRSRHPLGTPLALLGAEPWLCASAPPRDPG